MDNFDREYDALRSEQRYRYEHINKLNSGFITFTTAVLTIGFGLFVMVSSVLEFNTGLNEQVAELQEQVIELQEQEDALQNEIEIKQDRIENIIDEINMNKSVEVGAQLLQAMFFLAPILYSKICFNHSLENNVRISLISSYLEAANPNKINWDSFRHKNDIRYFFDSFGVMIKTEKVGDLKNMHRLISILSALLGLFYGGGVFYNCIQNYGLSNMLSATMIFGGGLSILLHTLIALVFGKINNNKLNDKEGEKKRLIIRKKHSKFIINLIRLSTNLRNYLTAESDNERLFQKQKKINTIFTWFFCVVEAGIFLSLLLFIDLAKYDERIVLCAGAFIVFATFCIWQFPCYALECNIADWRIRQHDEKAKKEFASTKMNSDCE